MPRGGHAAGAAIGAAVAVVAGLWDMKRERLEEETHHRVHTHMKVGYAVLGAVALVALSRARIMFTGAAPGWGYLIAASCALALTLYQAWLGGELVFHHGAGVLPTGQGPAGRTDRDETSAPGQSSQPGSTATHAHSHGHSYPR